LALQSIVSGVTSQGYIAPTSFPERQAWKENACTYVLTIMPKQNRPRFDSQAAPEQNRTRQQICRIAIKEIVTMHHESLREC
jgi:hypothetical protein